MYTFSNGLRALLVIIAVSGCSNPNGDDDAAFSAGQSSAALVAAVPVTWELAQNIAVSGSNVRKSGGVASAEDGRAFSDQAIVGGQGSLEFGVYNPPAGESPTFGWMGLTPSTQWISGDRLEWGFRFQASNWEIYEYSVAGGREHRLTGTRASGDRFRISVTGSTARFYRNNQLVFTSAKSVPSRVRINASLYNGGFDNVQLSGTTCGSSSGFVSAPRSTVNGQSVTLYWLTGTPANSSVRYGVASSNENRPSPNTALVTTHTIGLSGLLRGTTYKYRVFSQDAAGNIVSSGDLTFTTAP